MSFYCDLEEIYGIFPPHKSLEPWKRLFLSVSTIIIVLTSNNYVQQPLVVYTLSKTIIEVLVLIAFDIMFCSTTLERNIQQSSKLLKGLVIFLNEITSGCSSVIGAS